MVKIIISGTSDGFYPRYASDGILGNNDVSQFLMDRRRFLAKGNLYREGYSFQSLERGIFFHKIILLFDGFGREGFVMASLFLPDGDFLSGREIKDALDSIINSYKALTNNGMARFDIDWSFVKRIADELNAKVRPMVWRKHPTGGDNSRIALVKGLDDSRVADFFQYPVPLHSVFGGYEQVFLNESLLDLNLDNEKCTFISANEIDIDNPEYVIEYVNLQNGAILQNKRTTITKRELDQPGNINLGSYSKTGYHEASICIRESEKNSPDGVAIVVTLPTLQPMLATIEMNVVDSESGTLVDVFSVEWSNPKSEAIPYHESHGKYVFSGAACESTWCYIVRGEGYETYSGDIFVSDGMTRVLDIRIKRRPLWDISILTPQGKMFMDNITDEDLNFRIESEKKLLTDKGYKVKVSRNDAGRSIDIVASIPMAGSEDSSESPVTYLLKLDKKSKKYPLFKNKGEKIVIRPEGVRYDPKNHLLIWNRSESPAKDERIMLNDDTFFKYQIQRPSWKSNDVDLKLLKETPVRLILKTPFRYLGLCCGILAAVVIILCLRHSNAGDSPNLELIRRIEVCTNSTKSYCGDNDYEALVQIRNEIKTEDPSKNKIDTLWKTQGRRKTESIRIWKEIDRLLKPENEPDDRTELDELLKNEVLFAGDIENNEDLKNFNIKYDKYQDCKKNSDISVLEKFISEYSEGCYYDALNEKLTDLLIQKERDLFTKAKNGDEEAKKEYRNYANTYQNIFRRIDGLERSDAPPTPPLPGDSDSNVTSFEKITTFKKFWDCIVSRDDVVNFDTKYQLDGPTLNNSVFEKRLENLREKVRAIDEEQYNMLYEAADNSSSKKAECLKTLEKSLGL